MAPPPFTQTALLPCNPVTERGVSTKLHISKDSKLVYANGRTVIVRWTVKARNVSMSQY